MATSFRTMHALQAAIRGRCVRACHDLSEGGLAVAAAESAFGGALGVEINLAGLPAPMHEPGPSVAALLFGESAGRFLVEVPPDKYDTFLRIVKDVPFGELGAVNGTGRIVIKAKSGTLIDMTIEQAMSAWRSTFNW